VLVRIGSHGRTTFQLRPGELGLSVFQVDGVDPPLSNQEILESFRSNSTIIHVAEAEIESAGLVIEAVPGIGLPLRLQESHREIRPGPTMSRGEFKQALRRLEPDVE
jgi:hypothetical protein